MAKWQRIEWGNGNNMSGPADAVKAVAERLTAQGKDYTITDIQGPKVKRTTTKKVSGVELQVRDTPTA